MRAAEEGQDVENASEYFIKQVSVLNVNNFNATLISFFRLSNVIFFLFPLPSSARSRPAGAPALRSRRRPKTFYNLVDT